MPADSLQVSKPLKAGDINFRFRGRINEHRNIGTCYNSVDHDRQITVRREIQYLPNCEFRV